MAPDEAATDKADVRDAWSVDHVDARLREANWGAFRAIAKVLERYPTIRLQVCRVGRGGRESTARPRAT